MAAKNERGSPASPSPPGTSRVAARSRPSPYQEISRTRGSTKKPSVCSGRARRVCCSATPFPQSRTRLRWWTGGSHQRQSSAESAARGISCPASQERPSIALRTKGTILETPPGTVAGLAFQGDDIEFHALTAQGAIATGPIHAVTKASTSHIIMELDGRPAIEALRSTLARTMEKDPRVAELLKSALLIGLRSKGSDDAFLVRQVRGAGADGSLLVGDDTISEETECRFMMRDDVAARTDLDDTLKRYSLEKMFKGGGRPLLSILVTCGGRGEGLFKENGVDSAAIAGAVDAPCVGFCERRAGTGRGTHPVGRGPHPHLPARVHGDVWRARGYFR